MKSDKFMTVDRPTSRYRTRPDTNRIAILKILPFRKFTPTAIPDNVIHYVSQPDNVVPLVSERTIYRVLTHHVSGIGFEGSTA